MTTETKQALDAVLALVEKAAPGPLLVRDENDGDAWPMMPLWAVENPAFDSDDEEGLPLQAVIYYGGREDAEAFAAAVNFLRAEGPNLAHIPADWQPTPEAINALPEPLRAYIHRIQSSHPSYDNAVRIRQLEEQVEQLQAATACVEANLHSLQSAIDAAMAMAAGEDAK